MIELRRKRVKKIEYDKFKSDTTIFSEMLLSEEYEMLIFMKKGNYYGYIDIDNFDIIMLPEFYTDFSPVVLEPMGNVFVKANELFAECPMCAWIPLKCYDEVWVFLHYYDANGEETGVKNYLDILERDCGKELPFLLEIFDDKKAVQINEINEITWRCYRLLRARGQEVYVFGWMAKILGIESERKICNVSDKEMLMLTLHDLYYAAYYISQNKFFEQAVKLKAKGINAYTVGVPTWEELQQHFWYETAITKLGISVGRIQNGHSEDDFWMKKIVRSEGAGNNGCLVRKETHPNVLGSEEPTVYLIGPCIVGGWENIEDSSLAHLLYEQIVLGEMPYRVERVVIGYTDIEVEEKIQELDISRKDILFFINTYAGECKSKVDVDLLEDFNRRSKGELWFTNSVMHTLKPANEAIVKRLISIVYYVNSLNFSYEYLQVKRNFMNDAERKKLAQYIENVKMRNIEKGAQIGAIVMNGNPFTLGHLHLVEFAANQVDYLYLFVVEEDLSEFSFVDRFSLIKLGTEYLDNVHVVPSGEFILSKHTMISYFEKDKLQEQKIDAAFDVAFFGSYIAPALHITRRFVGEEPKDTVTRQYNKTMKEKLPLYGVQVTEIPRKCHKRNVISASEVRKLYLKNDWQQLQEYVPECTYSFLRTNPVMRNKVELLNRLGGG